jgi:hypothetical protein
MGAGLRARLKDDGCVAAIKQMNGGAEANRACADNGDRESGECFVHTVILLDLLVPTTK